MGSTTNQSVSTRKRKVSFSQLHPCARGMMIVLDSSDSHSGSLTHHRTGLSLPTTMSFQSRVLSHLMSCSCHLLFVFDSIPSNLIPSILFYPVLVSAPPPRPDTTPSLTRPINPSTSLLFSFSDSLSPAQDLFSRL